MMKKPLFLLLLSAFVAAAPAARAQDLAAEMISLFSTLCVGTYPDERALERLVVERRGVLLANEVFLKALSIPEKTGRGWQIKGQGGEFTLLISEGGEQTFSIPGLRRRNRECTIHAFTPVEMDVLEPLHAVQESYARQKGYQLGAPLQFEIKPPLIPGSVEARLVTIPDNPLAMSAFVWTRRNEDDGRFRYSLQFKPPEQ
jgi:hypothetical protein